MVIVQRSTCVQARPLFTTVSRRYSPISPSALFSLYSAFIHRLASTPIRHAITALLFSTYLYCIQIHLTINIKISTLHPAAHTHTHTRTLPSSTLLLCIKIKRGQTVELPRKHFITITHTHNCFASPTCQFLPDQKLPTRPVIPTCFKVANTAC